MTWMQQGPLPSYTVEETNEITITYRVTNLDMLGIFLPLSKILGEILEHHFLSEHQTFNTNGKFLIEIRQRIIQNLEQWFHSFAALVGPNFCMIADPECELSPAPEIPTVAYYGLHMYHCMFVLLHGPMDVVRMYQDHAWQASSDFLTVGEHAAACANSSFIFLILAQKLGRQSDDLILRNCAINLQVLDMFVATTNMDYQRTFAKFLRRALSYNMAHSSSADASEDNQSLAEALDPEMLAYRWIPGYRGLQINSTALEEPGLQTDT
ncbi:unnamed protein product [Penicillium glandicola]